MLLRVFKAYTQESNKKAEQKPRLILSDEPIPGELLPSRARFRFNSSLQNSKQLTIFTTCQKRQPFTDIMQVTTQRVSGPEPSGTVGGDVNQSGDYNVQRRREENGTYQNGGKYSLILAPRDNKVTLYNKSKVLATFPLDKFRKIGNNQNTKTP